MTVVDQLPDARTARVNTVSALISRYEGPLLRVTVRLTNGDRGWAEDVVQETFIRAWKSADLLTAQHGSVRGWLFRVAHNLVVDGYRSSKVRPMTADLDAVPLVCCTDDVEETLTRITVQQLLAELPAKQRAVMTCVFLHDLTPAQAATLLNIPLGTAKSRMYYALRRLRELDRREFLIV